MWIAYNGQDKNTLTEAEKLIREMLDPHTGQSTVYSDGLTIEEEPYAIYNRGTVTQFKTEFAGTVISGNMNSTEFGCQTLNKNWKHLRRTGKQKIAKYPHHYCYIHDRIKYGVIIGSINRMDSQNTWQKTLRKHLYRNIYEMKMIGYTERSIKKVIYKLKRKDKWKQIAGMLLNRIPQIFRT